MPKHGEESSRMGSKCLNGIYLTPEGQSPMEVTTEGSNLRKDGKMKVNITARHLELTPALKEYAQKKLEQVKKHTRKITTAHIILNVEKDRHIAEVVLGVAKSKINAKTVAGDMYASIDLVMSKIVKQLRKHLDKIKEHKDVLPYTMVENMAQEDYARKKPRELFIDEVREINIIKQTEKEVVAIMKSRKFDFWVFESEEGDVNIIYKKDSGKYCKLIIK